MKKLSRRKFVETTALGIGALPLLGALPVSAWNDENIPGMLPIHIFSKHLQFLDCRAAAEAAAELGFAGLDLTVRPGGHVEPASVREELPLAVEAIKQGGSGCSLMTTAVEAAINLQDMAILETASGLGINHYRCNWYRYHEDMSMKASLQIYQKQINALAQRNEELGLVGCYQNHAGTYIGASLWEIAQLLETANPDYFGIQYDIRHATVEGGRSWENGLRLIKDRIKTIVLKDFKWDKVEGKWTLTNTPIGEGMVDFRRYFGLLKQYGIDVPVILHTEYPLGGAEHGKRKLEVDKKVVFEAMQRDFNTIQELWAGA